MECHDKVTDVVFVLDSSVSVRESAFNSQLHFVQKLINTFTIAPNSVKVGVITFGTDIRLDFHLNQHERKKHLENAVNNIAYLKPPQGTNTG